MFITDAWKQKLSYIKQVPGVEFEFRDDETVLEEHSFFRAFRFSMRKEDRGEKEEEEQHQHATAVVVIGGITRAEISTLRWMAEHSTMGVPLPFHVLCFSPTFRRLLLRRLKCWHRDVVVESSLVITAM